MLSHKDRYLGLKEKHLIVIVNGYGYHLDTPLSWIYLPKVVRFVNENAHRLTEVICCGGYTQRRTAPGVSEAELMSRYILSHCNRDILSSMIFIEADSYTSYENSLRAAGRIEQLFKRQDGSGGKVHLHRENVHIVHVHFCEATRAANVAMLDRHFISGRALASYFDIAIETASWE